MDCTDSCNPRIASDAVRQRSLSSSPSSAPSSGAGIALSQYFVIMFSSRLSRLPRSLARSLLYRVTYNSLVKLASWPSTMPEIRK